MVLKVTEQFNRDISKLRDRKLIVAVKKALQKIEAARALPEIAQVKKMEGSSRYFRLRIGDYRLGVFAEGNTVYAVRFLHRKDIYKYFP